MNKKRSLNFRSISTFSNAFDAVYKDNFAKDPNVMRLSQELEAHKKRVIREFHSDNDPSM